MLQSGVPILGQTPQRLRRWMCPRCGDDPQVGQWPPNFQTPDGRPVYGPSGQITTIAGESGPPVVLCMPCMVRWWRKSVPALVEVGPDGTIPSRKERRVKKEVKG